MKRLPGLISVLLMSGIAWSCSSETAEQGKKNNLPSTGTVHSSIACRDDSALTYSLYLPEGLKAGKVAVNSDDHTGNRLLPCLIAFDPHGEGTLPVNLYKELAGKYGYILVGSNNSKNGLPPSEIDNIVKTLFDEVKSLYPVDTGRIYLLGFSGGARVASLSAFYKVPVKGVIGCGAGIAGASEAPRHRVDYYGLAGMADFNMNEMEELGVPLTRAGLRHVISIFDGIHEWPPAGVMEEAFQWFTLNAMKDGMVSRDDGLIDTIMGSFSSKLTSLQNRGLLTEAAATCRNAIAFGQGLTSTNNFNEQLAGIENNPLYLSQVSYRTKVLQSEEKERRELMDALSGKDLAWWTNYVSQKNIGAKKGTKTGITSKDPMTFGEWQHREDTFKNMRLMAFLRLLCYMNATSVLTSRNEEAAGKIIRIYQITDPDNPEAYYLNAILLARQPGSPGAMEQLTKAVEKGFSEKLRMTEQPEFTALKETPAFYDLLQKIK